MPAATTDASRVFPETTINLAPKYAKIMNIPAIIIPIFVFPLKYLIAFLANKPTIRPSQHFIISVGNAQNAYPVERSASAEPTPPAKAPANGPQRPAQIYIPASPRFMYQPPSGIGICTKVVRTNTSAVKTAV